MAIITSKHNCKVLQVTPQQAAVWLKENTHNRPLKPSVVRRYAREMLAGRWMLTHQGIAFSASGWLLDGQHRLAAVVESGVTVPMILWTGMPDETQIAVDDHVKRSPFDAISLLDGCDYTATEVQIARTLVRSYVNFSDKAVSKYKIVECLAKYRDGISFAAELKDSRGAAKGISMVINFVVIARASYHVTDDRLREFVSVLFSGVPQDPTGDVAAVTYRNFVLTYLGRFGSGGSAQSAAYRKCERAVRAFADFEPLTRCYAANSELFPLPDEALLALDESRAKDTP